MPIMKISPEIVEEAEKLYREGGWTYDKLAAKYNVHPSTLRGRLINKDRIEIRRTGSCKVRPDTLTDNLKIIQTAKHIFNAIKKGQDINYIVKRHSGNGNKIVSRKGHGTVIAKDNYKFTILREGHHTPESFMYNDLVDRTIMVG